VNHYINARIAEQRMEQTARQARTAWWRAQAASPEKSEASTRPPRLHWIAPVTARITGA
jgi:hypothetical protein